MDARRRALFAAVTGVLTASVCGGMFLGYYVKRAHEYASIDYAFEGDFPVEKDEELGFVPVRNGATLRRHPGLGVSFHVFTNDRRARVDAPGVATPSPAIVTVGCSFSWGDGVENEQTYTAILGRRLGVAVANLAFAGYGTTQSLGMLERSLAFRPRVVIYGFIDDHLERNLRPCAPNFGPACLPCPSVAFDADDRPFIRRPHAELFDLNRRFWLAFFGGQGSTLRRALLVAEADLESLAVAREAARAQDPEARIRALSFLLREMHAKAHFAGATLLLAYIPNLRPSGERRLPGALKKAVSKLPDSGWELLDLTPVVAAHYSTPGAAALAKRDRHPNAVAHSLIAGQIEALIRAKALLGGERSVGSTRRSP